jgi:cellulose synthase/poly-beta-1,6-N-acetylglucosamine synthase-like glycosyltransferase
MLVLLFAMSLALITFAYAGYPLLLAIRARLAPKPVARAPFTPPLTIVVVGHNEAAGIAAKIRSCLELRYPPERLRLLVVSDGSTDGMADVVRAATAADSRVRLLEFAERRGKAACLNDALAACADEFVLLTDVRQPLDPDAAACLLENFADATVGAAGGELVFRTDDATGFGEGMDAYWRYEKFIREKEGIVGSTVGVSGALYALRRALWRPIPPETILDDVMIPMNVVAQGRRVVFDSRAIAFDRPSPTPARERVRKVRTLAGNFQLVALRPDLLSPRRNPILFQFVCHKLLRLAVPLAMLLALACNALLAAGGGAFWRALLLAQVAGYAVAIAGLAAPALCRWLPVKLIATFVSLNAFVVMGFVDFLRNREAHLWRTQRGAT